MEKNILVIVDEIPTFNIALTSKDTIGMIKKVLKDYGNYNVAMYVNPQTELKVFNTEEYDNMTLKSVWKQLESPTIVLTKKEKTFTGIKDVDLKILSELPDEDLFKTCNINKYVRRICTDENFWKRRFMNLYGDFDKPSTETWKDFYVKTQSGYKIFCELDLHGECISVYVSKIKRHPNDILRLHHVEIKPFDKHPPTYVWGLTTPKYSEEGMEDFYLETPLVEKQSQLNIFRNEMILKHGRHVANYITKKSFRFYP